MDTEDYIHECTTLLMDNKTYRVVTKYPFNEIKSAVENVCSKFQENLKHINKTLQNLLVPRENNNTTPKFYGIPKVHKDFQNFPPVRPIIAQTGSPLAPSARFIDHVLQPIARSYADYIDNSTTLINMLDSIFVPEGAILVTIDVVSLYPSIPQTECLRIIYEEMFNHLFIMVSFLLNITKCVRLDQILNKSLFLSNT